MRLASRFEHRKSFTLEFHPRSSRVSAHGRKGFVLPTKSFVKIGTTKIFCYDNKMFSSIKKRLVAAAKFLAAATKKLFVVPNFVAVTKPFFSVRRFTRR